MKTVMLSMGRTRNPELIRLIDDYTQRVKHYTPMEYVELPDVKTRRGITEQQRKDAEGEVFLSLIKPGDTVVLLDEHGREYTSREFSSFLSRKMVSVSGRLVFVIGGPYGFSEAMHARGNEKLSLSRMTFSHEMVRLFFVEQIYRAMTILNNEPYHHD